MGRADIVSRASCRSPKPFVMVSIDLKKSFHKPTILVTIIIPTFIKKLVNIANPSVARR